MEWNYKNNQFVNNNNYFHFSKNELYNNRDTYSLSDINLDFDICSNFSKQNFNFEEDLLPNNNINPSKYFSCQDEAKMDVTQTLFLTNKKHKLFHIRKVPKIDLKPLTIGMRMKIKKNKIKERLEKNKNVATTTDYLKDKHEKRKLYPLFRDSTNYTSFNNSISKINSNLNTEEKKLQMAIAKKTKTILQNRQSAQLSRERKLKELSDLKALTDQLKIENSLLQQKIEEMENELSSFKLNYENCTCYNKKQMISIKPPFNNLKEEIENKDILKNNQKLIPEVDATTKSPLQCNFNIGMLTSFLIVICIIGSLFWSSLFSMEEYLSSFSSLSRARMLVKSINLDFSNISAKSIDKEKNSFKHLVKIDFFRDLMASLYHPKESLKVCCKNNSYQRRKRRRLGICLKTEYETKNISNSRALPENVQISKDRITHNHQTNFREKAELQIFSDVIESKPVVKKIDYHHKDHIKKKRMNVDEKSFQ